jgi:hypothetical protein
MATAKVALEKMRKICLSFPDTSEGPHFGQTGFYVQRKLFAVCGAKHGIWQIAFGLEADHAALLAENDPRFKLHPRDKRGVVIDAADVKSWGELEALLSESYDLVKPKKKPAKRSAPVKRSRR